MSKQMIIRDVPRAQTYPASLARINAKIRCVLACPIIIRERVVGMVAFASDTSFAKAWSSDPIRELIEELAANVDVLARAAAIPSGTE